MSLCCFNGYSLHADGVQLVMSESKAGLVKAAKEFKEQGLSLRNIAAKLLDLGYQPRGQNFTRKQSR